MNRVFERPTMLPFRSLAAALLFCVFLGPVGLLYSSLTGGVILIVLALLVLRAKAFALLGILWLIACVWGVFATHYFNRRILTNNDKNYY